MFKRTALCAVIVACGMALGAGPLAAQQGGVKRTILQKTDVPGTNYELLLGIAEVAPNVVAAPHTHPGPVAAYILQGSNTLTIQGQPPRSLQPGQSALIPANTVHTERAGPAGVKEIAVYVVEKGKPLATPAK